MNDTNGKNAAEGEAQTMPPAGQNVPATHIAIPMSLLNSITKIISKMPWDDANPVMTALSEQGKPISLTANEEPNG